MFKRFLFVVLLAALAILFLPSGAHAQCPPGYYGPGCSQGGGGSSMAPAAVTGSVILDPTCPVVPTINCFFWNANVRVYTDATTNTGSNIITISGGDHPFTSTETLINGTTRPWIKVGQIIFCTNNVLRMTGTMVLAQTTVSSIDSATQIHTVANAGTNQVANANCYIGDDDTANITAHWNALVAGCGLNGATNGLLSSGIAFTTKGQWNTSSNACNTAFGYTYTEPALFGAGEGMTTIMPLPNFDFTIGAGNSCQGGLENPGEATLPLTPGTHQICFGDFFSEFSFINIWGGGYTAAYPATDIALFGFNARVNSTNTLGWMAQTAPGVSHFLWGAVNTAIVGRWAQGGSLYFGSYPYVAISNGYTIGNVFVGGVYTYVVWLAAAPGGISPASSYNTVIGPSSGDPAGCSVLVVSNSQFNEYSDNIIGASGNLGIHCVQSNGYAAHYGGSITQGGGTPIFQASASGARTEVQNTTVLGGGAPFIASMAAGAIFDDQGGNRFGSASGFTGLGSVAHMLSADSAVCATGNWALTSGWGTSTVTSVGLLNGNSHDCRVVITGAAGAANPVLTWTFPTAYQVLPPTHCNLFENTIDIASLTSVSAATPTLTNVAFTFAGIPIAVTYTFDVRCGP
jgi:hypothetical protein